MKKGIFQIDTQGLKSFLGLPDEVKILDMRIIDGSNFDCDEEREPTLEVKINWEGLPLETRSGEQLPRYSLIASAEKKDCGHTEIEAALNWDDDTKSNVWRMK